MDQSEATSRVHNKCSEPGLENTQSLGIFHVVMATETRDKKQKATKTLKGKPLIGWAGYGKPGLNQQQSHKSNDHAMSVMLHKTGGVRNKVNRE